MTQSLSAKFHNVLCWKKTSTEIKVNVSDNGFASKGQLPKMYQRENFQTAWFRAIKSINVIIRKKQVK
jgi:hypothetical protein